MDQPKFNKTFEALYAIAMKAADECIVNKPLEKRFEKLTEEYDEVIKSGNFFMKHNDDVALKNLHGELSDLLFVILHIAHITGGVSGFELLHIAVSKMILRMNDPKYIAKN